MSTAEQVIRQVRAIVAGRSLPADPTTEPARLLLGERSHQWISDAAGWTSVHRGRLLPALYGLPIETVELDRGWQVFSGTGALIAHGTVTEP